MDLDSMPWIYGVIALIMFAAACVIGAGLLKDFKDKRPFFGPRKPKKPYKRKPGDYL